MTQQSMETRQMRYHAPETAPLRLGALVNWSGAVVSLALVAGLGWWSYQLMMRDVSGVPVVRALEGPVRVAPEDPGGRQAAYQGLAVNAVAAGIAFDEGGGQIILAPQPIDLSDEDIPRASGGESEHMRPSTPPAVVEVAYRPQAAQDTAQRAQLPPPDGPLLAPHQSPRPPARPAALAQSATGASGTSESSIALAIASQVAASQSRQGGADIDPASLQPGTRLVQLGTFASAEDARNAWTAIARRFNPHLDGRGRVIEAAHSGGSVFYRLRAHGFEGEADARRFCAVLLAQNADCIPVLIR